ncbi:hypothetical protein [Marinobacter caseinilyticus]|uniref:hypothetical protein n=1 Tax=Marinobacter caseinilyticus TaxID=2692195 RepID=UPI0014097157|nr:hypothetical protein [Marinobacter caseinilyticus]
MKKILLVALVGLALAGCKDRVIWEDNGAIKASTEDRKVWDREGQMENGERKIWNDSKDEPVIK